MATGGNRQPNPSKAVAPEKHEVRLCPGLGQQPDTGTGSLGGRSQPWCYQPQVERRDHVQTACPWGASRRIWSNGPGAWERWKRPECMEASSRCPGQETDSLPASAVGPTKETDLCPTAGVIPSELEKKNNLTSGLAPRQRKHQSGQNAQQERRPMTKWMKQ